MHVRIYEAGQECYEGAKSITRTEEAFINLARSLESELSAKQEAQHVPAMEPSAGKGKQRDASVPCAKLSS